MVSHGPSHSVDLLEVVGAGYCLRLDLGNYLIDCLFPFWEACGKPMNIRRINLERYMTFSCYYC